MNQISLICLFLIAIFVAAPVSAFVDRNGVTSAAQFKDNIPASYLAKAGVTDGMTVDQALDAYITYALSFSSPTAYAYIAQLTNPADVKIRAGGSTAPASRGDVVAEAWNIEVGDGTLVAIRYPGSVMHTIKGPYTYPVPAYQNWGASANFGPEDGAIVTGSVKPDGLPDTTGYKTTTAEIPCRGVDPINAFEAFNVGKVKGSVYAVYYTRNPQDRLYSWARIPEGEIVPLPDDISVIVGPGSSATIEKGLDLIHLPEKTVFELTPRWNECVLDAGKVREKTIFDTFKFDVLKPIMKFLGYNVSEGRWEPSEIDRIMEKQRTTVVAGVRG
ncbi:MAG: hypothetical protein Q8R70_03495 [Methanoregula sp.]|nr:hypothetical protein [Methanoregula sp.]